MNNYTSRFVTPDKVRQYYAQYIADDTDLKAIITRAEDECRAIALLDNDSVEDLDDCDYVVMTCAVMVYIGHILINEDVDDVDEEDIKSILFPIWKCQCGNRDDHRKLYAWYKLIMMLEQERRRDSSWLNRDTALKEVIDWAKSGCYGCITGALEMLVSLGEIDVKVLYHFYDEVEKK